MESLVKMGASFPVRQPGAGLSAGRQQKEAYLETLKKARGIGANQAESFMMSMVELSDSSMAVSEEVSQGTLIGEDLSEDEGESGGVPRPIPLSETAEEDAEEEMDADPPEALSEALGLSPWSLDLGQYPYPALLPVAKVARMGCIRCKTVETFSLVDAVLSWSVKAVIIEEH